VALAAISSKLARSRSTPRHRRNAPATAWKLLEDACRFAMCTSLEPVSWPQGENRKVRVGVHAGFGQEKGITGERRPPAGERACE